MPRVIRRISSIVYGLGIVAAFSFGASQALGQTVQLTCRYEPPTWLGACVNGDTAECGSRCRAGSGDEEAIGICPDGCCVCLL